MIDAPEGVAMVRVPGIGPQVTRQRLHHSGVGPVRVLLIGDRDHLAADAGGATLLQRAVDRVWLTSRRGVDLDALSDLAPVVRRVSADVHAWRIWRYDAVVVLRGPEPAVRRDEQVLAQLADLLRGDAERGTPVALLSPAGRPPGPEARRLLDAAAAASGGSLRTAEVAGREPRDWAAAVGEQVDAIVRAAAPATADAEDEAARQQALDDSGVLGRRGDPRLDDLVELARAAFGAESAEINFIDRDRQWKLAVAGSDGADGERAHSFCNQTIRRPEPVVVGDARLHPVLGRSPLVHGPRPIRFYAAYPIESADGYRIGSFCVYDSEPRDVRGLDLAVLRDLALLAQAELVAQDSAPRGLSPVLEVS